MSTADNTTYKSKITSKIQTLKKEIEKDCKVLDVLTKDLSTRLQKNKIALASLEQDIENLTDNSSTDSYESLLDAFKKTKFLCAKWEQFFPIYERYFSPFKKACVPVELLELGVQNGGSLEMWRSYFPNNSHITGIDTQEKCRHIPFSDGITYLHGDATDANFLQSQLSEKKFDIIIDDASHYPDDVITSFELLFPKLKMGGIYVIEDTHTSYWKNYGAGLQKATSHVEYFKNIADVVNFTWVREEDYTIWGDKLSYYKQLRSEIAHIAFYDSVIVIEKFIKPIHRNFNILKSQGKAILSDYPKGITCSPDFTLDKFFK